MRAEMSERAKMKMLGRMEEAALYFEQSFQ